MIAHPKKGQRWTAKATQDHQRKANQSFFSCSKPEASGTTEL